MRSGQGSTQAFGVVGASNNSQAVGVAAGMAALVAQKFSYSPAQAGQVLKTTACNAACTASGYNLSVARALAPAGNLR